MRDFRAADDGFFTVQVAATNNNWEVYWRHWSTYSRAVGVDPYLSTASFRTNIRLLTGFAARVRSGYYGRKKQVAAGTVSKALTANGQRIAMERGINPTKLAQSKDLLPQLAQTLKGWRKLDPPTTKQLPVESDVPELLAATGARQGASELVKAVRDWTLIAFYYLLQVGEYTIKGSRNETKQTTQYRMRDVMFFRKDKHGRLHQLSRQAPPWAILSANGATLKLENQKNGWKGMCVHHEPNGDKYFCPVRALGRQFIHIRDGGAPTDGATLLSAYFISGHHYNITDKNIWDALKWTGATLDYPGAKGMPLDRINTHSLRSGGANALSLSGYSEMEIQKMGQWQSATFMEYISEELACFSVGMSTQMRKKFGFVNVAGGVYRDVTNDLLNEPYSANVSAQVA